VFFELLTGRKPYIADTPAGVMVKQITAPLPSVLELVPGLSEGVEQSIHKALAKQSGERYSSMAEFAEVLEGLASGTLILHPPRKERAPSPIDITFDGINKIEKKTRRRIPAWGLRLAGVLGLGIVALAVIAGAETASLFGVQPTPTPAVTETLLASQIPAQTATPKPSPTLINTHTPAPSPTPKLGIGSTLVSQKDGMAQVYVPEGEFLMGAAQKDGQAFADENPQHTVWLDAFWIDQTEVTNTMYAKCVSDGVCIVPDNGYIRWGSADLYFGNSKYDNFPVAFIDWSQADAYCRWARRRLPTEAEWEKAARGTDGRTYPWGEGIGCDKANFKVSCVGNPSKVGSYLFGASPYGALDMNGNLWEFVADWYLEDYYINSPYRNPTGPDSGLSRVFRGGAHDGSLVVEGVRITKRGFLPPDSLVRGNNLGFRCALGATP
jgi:formylglycine-generating enzyme required for sulfatase activity